MSLEPDIKFIKENAAEHLQEFTDEARASENEAQWRCLYVALNPEITKDPSTKNIATEFLKSSFDDADDTKAFWLTSGHLFVFFQGPVRAVIKDYESFLDSLSEDNKRAEYHFFWELNEFWGYFDEVLASALEKMPAIKTHQPPPPPKQAPATKEQESFAIPNVLHRQRHARYKPLLLIVEDDRVTRHLLQAVMEKYCDIAVAWDAEQAQQLYKTMLPNITFLDIQLPDGDGQELAELFCAHDPESFVVMVSGMLSQEKIQRCMKAGAKGTVEKPAKEGQLLEFIDQYNKARQKKAASA